jgi:hypothetical protein
MPTAREAMFVGVVGTNIYVIGGGNSTEVLNVNEIYNTTTNNWSTGAPMPTAMWIGAAAVVNDVVYAIGGSNPNSLVWQNIDRLLLSRGIGKVELKRIVRRNKNTYTNWFMEPRPILKISDVDEIAAALDIAPSELLKTGLTSPP